MTLQEFYGQSHIDLELLTSEIEELRQQISNVKKLNDNELPEFSRKFLLYDLEKQCNLLIIKLEREKEKLLSKDLEFKNS